MRPLRRIETLAYIAVTSIVIAASCATAEDSPLADQGGGDDDDGGDDGGGKGGTVTGGTGGSATTGGSAGKGGSTTGGSAGKGGTTSTGGKGGTTSTGGTGPSTTTYGCLDDGQGGQGGASGGAPGAAGAGGSSTVTLFSDDFEDGDEAGWTSTSGEWSIVDDDTTAIEQSQFDGNDLRVASVVNACWADQIVEARVKVLDFGGNSTSYSANVFGRYVDSGTHYVVGMNSGSNGQLFIGKRVAGGGLQRLADEGDYGFDDNEDTWFTLRLEIVGTSLKAYLNDTLELEATDSQITSGGVAVGTTHASARFDDVRVTAP